MNLNQILLLFAALLQAACICQGFLTSKRNTCLKPLKASDSESQNDEIAIILLAGGNGKRMKSAMPKQFLPLLGKPVFLRSLDIFTAMDTVASIVIVLDESYRDDYSDLVAADKRIRWADPGTERQDSVFNALQRVPESSTIVGVHDAARPLVTRAEVEKVIQDAIITGAAVLGVPMKATVKESNDGEYVLRTVPRSRLWEVHTPQVIRKSLLIEGFRKVKAENLEITDDVSVIEALGLPVKLTLGEYTNIKLTTPDDLSVAEEILKQRGVKDFKEEEQQQQQSYGCNSERYRDSLSRK